MAERSLSSCYNETYKYGGSIEYNGLEYTKFSELEAALRDALTASDLRQIRDRWNMVLDWVKSCREFNELPTTPPENKRPCKPVLEIDGNGFLSYDRSEL